MPEKPAGVWHACAVAVGFLLNFLFLFVLFFIGVALYAEDSAIINEYFSKKECKEIVDRIIEKAGGEENIKNASSVS
mgnify:CR=1 FL=1